MRIPANYLEKLYAGWLGKVIGIRLGAPIEGWSYHKIQDVFGELWDYLVNYQDFAADDDSNGPMFFLRALEDSPNGYDITAQDVGEALLNYAPYEHGFFWWGGYGTSTEHTAYLNLRQGIPAPRSGSVEQNGAAVAEQIGGQIFIDTWGLVAPGNPDLAAKYAEKAASVTHGGNGIYGGIFIAAAISYAFLENDLDKIMDKALSYIPADCEYTRVVQAVRAFHKVNPSNWRSCYEYIFNHFGYDKYPGNCHIIPNIAVMILSLLYGNGDFGDTINICNMCGWDTDCNVANVGAIMGVRNGLEGIDYDKWRKPINDFLACSSVVGSLNAMDLPYCVSYIARLAYGIAGEKAPEPLNEIFRNRIDACHFEYPGSTHALRVRVEDEGAAERKNPEYWLANSDETAYTGARSLKVTTKTGYGAKRVYLYKRTHYTSKDFHDSRYDPFFSPLVYPGQTVHGSAYIPESAEEVIVKLYAKEARTGEIFMSDESLDEKGVWKELSFQIPALDGGLIREVGFLFIPKGDGLSDISTVFVDDLYFDGKPSYSVDFSKETMDVWNGLHREVSQFAMLKGLMYLEEGKLHLSCSDFAEAYTGGYNWEDYTATFELTPLTGERHYVNFRVQGAIRSYAAGFDGAGKFALLKNENGYSRLCEVDIDWKAGQDYHISVELSGNVIKVSLDDKEMFTYTDTQRSYKTGSVGVSVHNGSHCTFKEIVVK